MRVWYFLGTYRAFFALALLGLGFFFVNGLGGVASIFFIAASARRLVSASLYSSDLDNEPSL
jgi:hypothetical protein